MAAAEAPAVGKQVLDTGWLAARSTEVALTGVELTTTHPRSSSAAAPWMHAAVPGTVLGTLLKNKLIPDPFYGLNNEAIIDIADSGREYYTFWFFTTFQCAPAGNQHVSLNFRAINYSAEVYINGHKEVLLKGMFRRHTLDITEVLHPDGSNLLAVLVHPPDHPGTIPPQGGQGGDHEVWQEFWITGDVDGRGVPVSNPDGPLDHALFLLCARDTVKLLRNYASLALWVGVREQKIQGKYLSQDSTDPSKYLDGTRVYVQGSMWDGFADGKGDFSDGPYEIQYPESFFKDSFYKYGFNPEVGNVGVPVAATIRATMPPEGWSIPIFRKGIDGYIKEVPNPIWITTNTFPTQNQGRSMTKLNNTAIQKILMISVEK
ncbi:hypothetical protein ACQ4PT_010252 [Festuca glaucescens]